MAYKTELDLRCMKRGCRRKARFEVHAYRDALLGRYCGPHTDARVKALTEAEARSERREE